MNQAKYDAWKPAELLLAVKTWDDVVQNILPMCKKIRNTAETYKNGEALLWSDMSDEEYL